jgi:hypothetical protein
VQSPRWQKGEIYQSEGKLMEENNYRRLGEQYEDIGGTRFIVTSYSNQSAQKTSEQLIMQLLEQPALVSAAAIKEDKHENT